MATNKIDFSHNRALMSVTFVHNTCLDSASGHRKGMIMNSVHMHKVFCYNMKIDEALDDMKRASVALSHNMN